MAKLSAITIVPRFFLRTFVLSIFIFCSAGVAQESYDSFDLIAQNLAALINSYIGKKKDIKVTIPYFYSIEKGATPLGKQLAADFTASLSNTKKNFDIINPEIGKEAIREQLTYYAKGEAGELKKLMANFKTQYYIYAPFMFNAVDGTIEFSSGILVNGVALTNEGAATLCASKEFRLKLNGNILAEYRSLFYSTAILWSADSLFQAAQTQVDFNPTKALNCYMDAESKYRELGGIPVAIDSLKILRRKLAEFLDQIVLENKTSNLLVGIQGGSLADPLTVHAGYKGRGISGLNIKFKCSDGSVLIDTLAITDESGTAAAKIHKFNTTGRVRITALVNEILEIVPKTPPVQFDLRVKKRRSDITVFVLVKTSNMGVPNDASEELINQLKAIGFNNCVRDSTVNNPDLKITGSINSWLKDKYQGKYVVSASGNITYYEILTNASFTVPKSIQLPIGTDKMVLGAAAIAQLKRQLFDEIIKKLGKDYPE